MCAAHITVDPLTQSVARNFSELAVGDRCTETIRITNDLVEAFIKMSGDSAPVHSDASLARQMNYSGRVVHGLLVTLRFSRLLGMFVPGTMSVIHSIRFDYVRPVMIGDELTYSVTIARLSAAAKLAVLDLAASRDGKICAKGVAQCVLIQ
ncbi:MAG: hypothetical protein DMF72_04475 [Acidobacteria bacterium]|nr:MAG: hypothetical protein DMF72_04475 [Acidobacteriota bacterium]